MEQRRPGRRQRKRAQRKTTQRRISFSIFEPIGSLARLIGSQIRIVNLVIGIAIGAAVVWFLIAPASFAEKTADHNREIKEYSEQVDSKNAQISALSRTLDNYRSLYEDPESDQTSAAQIMSSYEYLCNAWTMYTSDNYSSSQVIDMLVNVDRDCLGTYGQSIYDQMSNNVYSGSEDDLFTGGYTAVNEGSYEVAKNYLAKLYSISPDYGDGSGVFYLGYAYFGMGDYENAMIYMQKVIDTYPGGFYATSAQDVIDQINNQGLLTNSTDTTATASTGDGT